MYFFELRKHDQEGRPGDNFNYKQFKNSKLCPMDTTK